MLHRKDQALKKSGEKLQKAVEVKKKSRYCKNKLFPSVASGHIEKNIFDTYKIRFCKSELPFKNVG